MDFSLTVNLSETAVCVLIATAGLTGCLWLAIRRVWRVPVIVEHN